MNTVRSGLFVSWERSSLLIKPIQDILIKNYLTVPRCGPRLANNTCEIILVAKQCDSFNICAAKHLVGSYLKMIGESKQNDNTQKEPEIIHLDVDEDEICIVLDDSVNETTGPVISGGEISSPATDGSSKNVPNEPNSLRELKRKNPFEDEHVPVVDVIDDDDVIVLDDSFTDLNILNKSSKNINLVDLTNIRSPPIDSVQENKSSQINAGERRGNGLSTPNERNFKKSKLSSLVSHTKTAVKKVEQFLANVSTPNTSTFDPSLSKINTTRSSNACTSTATASTCSIHNTSTFDPSNIINTARFANACTSTSATTSTHTKATGDLPRRNRKLTYKRPSHLVGTLTTSSSNTSVDSQSNIYNPNSESEKRTGLRPIVIDGNNVGTGHGNGEFSLKGLEICINFFEKRGHREIRAFLPHYRINHNTFERLHQLQRRGTVVITPSRKLDDRVIASYDDRFIVQYASEVGGVIVSTDNYRDLMKENPSWVETIQNRLLMFSWVGDMLMFPQDPLGRSGPSLNEFLSFPSL